MANDKRMNPISGEPVETDGVYRDSTGHEVELSRGDEFPMDPQIGTVEYRLVELPERDPQVEPGGDREAAEMTGIPVTAVNEEKARAKKSAALRHRQHGGER